MASSVVDIDRIEPGATTGTVSGSRMAAEASSRSTAITTMAGAAGVVVVAVTTLVLASPFFEISTSGNPARCSHMTLPTSEALESATIKAARCGCAVTDQGEPGPGLEPVARSLRINSKSSCRMLLGRVCQTIGVEKSDPANASTSSEPSAPKVRRVIARGEGSDCPISRRGPEPSAAWLI